MHHIQTDTICEISPEVKEELRKFRFKRDNVNSALIRKYKKKGSADFYL